MQIDEKKVEDAFGRLQAAINSGLRLDLAHLEALTERIRVELLIERLERERRDVYRATIDLLEAELERRYEDSGDDRDTVREQVIGYFRRLVSELTREDK